MLSPLEGGGRGGSRSSGSSSSRRRGWRTGGGDALTKGVWVPLADNFGSFPVGLASRESSHRFVLRRPALTTADGHNPKSLQLVSREEIVY